VSDQTNAWALLGEAVMDFRTRLLLGATALAVIGYFVLVYGGCALDEHCHLRSCGGRFLCGVIHDGDKPLAG
jgi:hypothetical protein